MVAMHCPEEFAHVSQHAGGMCEPGTYCYLVDSAALASHSPCSQQKIGYRLCDEEGLRFPWPCYVVTVSLPIALA
jgi:hypothetical protein